MYSLPFFILMTKYLTDCMKFDNELIKMFETVQSKLFRELFYLVKYNMIYYCCYKKHFGHSFAFDAPMGLE